MTKLIILKELFTNINLVLDKLISRIPVDRFNTFHLYKVDCFYYILNNRVYKNFLFNYTSFQSEIYFIINVFGGILKVAL